MPPDIIYPVKEKNSVEKIINAYKVGQNSLARKLYKKFIKDQSLGDFIWVAQKEVKETPSNILTMLRNIS